MSLEKNKDIFRKGIEAIFKGDLSVVDDIIAPDYVDHSNPIRGPEGVKQFYTMFFKGFSDVHRTIEDIVAEGDKVWLRSTITGTHTGEYLGFPPTGRKITMTGVNIYRIVDGKVVEGWSVNDMLDLFKQLGIVEYTEKGKKIFPENVS